MFYAYLPLQMPAMKLYFTPGRMEHRITARTNVFVWIRMGALPGVGLIVIAQRKGNSSVSEVGTHVECI